MQGSCLRDDDLHINFVECAGPATNAYVCFLRKVERTALIEALLNYGRKAGYQRAKFVSSYE